MVGVGGGAGRGVSEAGGCARRGGGEGVEGAHADESVQCASAVVGGCARCSGRGGVGGVWVRCGHLGGGCAGGVVGVEFGGR